jgi:hypothetical protein
MNPLAHDRKSILKTKRNIIGAFLAISMFSNRSIVVAENAAPSPPVPGTRMTEAYAKDIGRFAYFWAWPMMNMHNRRELLGNLLEPGLMGGIVPVSPPNQLCMLRDYIEPQERLVALPEPRRRLWFRHSFIRQRTGNNPSAGLW